MDKPVAAKSKPAPMLKTTGPAPDAPGPVGEPPAASTRKAAVAKAKK
jgi:hypothetical protein